VPNADSVAAAIRCSRLVAKAATETTPFRVSHANTEPSEINEEQVVGDTGFEDPSTDEESGT